MNYGLIGKSLRHSFSKDFFDQFFQEHGIEDHQYSLFEMEDLHQLKQLVQEKQLNGFNVTIPFKQEVIPYLDAIHPLAAELNAVNVVKVVGQTLHGYNTDHPAFLYAASPYLRARSKALILGTGASSKMVAHALREVGMVTHKVSSSGKGAFSYSDLSSPLVSEYALIINTTPLGTYPNTEEAPELPWEGISTSTFCFDLIYNPPKTRFLIEAEKRGATILNGLEMLKKQALLSWEIWSNNSSTYSL